MSPAAQDGFKRAAAEAAVTLVESGMVVGLGTGSTATFAIEALIRQVRAGLRIEAVATSERSASQARAGGIAVFTLEQRRRIDLTIDGADEVQRHTLALIKGLGGALLREKIVAAASARLVIIADASKLVDRLGEHVAVPVEVVQFGWQVTSDRIAGLGAEVARRETAPGEAYVTDGGNFIIDARFGAIADPAATDAQLHQVVGVIETGLFIGRAAVAMVAGADGVQRLEAR